MVVVSGKCTEKRVHIHRWPQLAAVRRLHSSVPNASNTSPSTTSMMLMPEKLPECHDIFFSFYFIGVL